MTKHRSIVRCHAVKRVDGNASEVTLIEESTDRSTIEDEHGRSEPAFSMSAGRTYPITVAGATPGFETGVRYYVTISPVPVTQ